MTGKMKFAQLPVIIKEASDSAPLPVNYEDAKSALQRCASIDECKDWADRSAALASYARQIKDKSLQETAIRIQVRAKTRIGELLLEIPPKCGGLKQKGGKGRFGGLHGSVPHPDSRANAAIKSGITAQQAASYASMAKVDKSQREFLIEKSPPVRPRELAAIGSVRSLVWKNRFVAGKAYAELTAGPFNRFANWIATRNAKELGSQMSSDEGVRLRERILTVIEWLDDLERSLPKNRSAGSPPAHGDEQKVAP